MRTFLTSLLLLITHALTTRGANPSFGDFNSNQFVTTGNKVVAKNGIILTNPVVGSGTLTGNGAGLTNVASAQNRLTLAQPFQPSPLQGTIETNATYQSLPVIFQAPDTNLIYLVYRAADLHTSSTNAALRLSFTTNAGAYWIPVGVVSQPAGYDPLNHADGVDSFGRLYTMHQMWDITNSSYSNAILRVSDDRGSTWATIASIPAQDDSPNFGPIPYGRIFEQDGILFSAVYMLKASYILRSLDRGTNWSSSLIYSNNTAGAGEPKIIGLGRGVVYCAMRRRDSPADDRGYFSISYDNGATWTYTGQSIAFTTPSGPTNPFELVYDEHGNMVMFTCDRSLAQIQARTLRATEILNATNWSRVPAQVIDTSTGGYVSALNTSGNNYLLAYYTDVPQSTPPSWLVFTNWVNTYAQGITWGGISNNAVNPTNLVISSGAVRIGGTSNIGNFYVFGASESDFHTVRGFNNDIGVAVKVVGDSSVGSITTNFGVGYTFGLYDAETNKVSVVGQVAAVWAQPFASNRVADMVFKTYNTSIGERMRLTGAGVLMANGSGVTNLSATGIATNTPAANGFQLLVPTGDKAQWSSNGVVGGNLSVLGTLGVSGVTTVGTLNSGGVITGNGSGLTNISGYARLQAYTVNTNSMTPGAVLPVTNYAGHFIANSNKFAISSYESGYITNLAAMNVEICFQSRYAAASDVTIMVQTNGVDIGQIHSGIGGVTRGTFSTFFLEGLTANTGIRIAAIPGGSQGITNYVFWVKERP